MKWQSPTRLLPLRFLWRFLCERTPRSHRCPPSSQGLDLTASSEVPVIPRLANRCPSKLAPVSSGHVPTGLRTFPEPQPARLPPLTSPAQPWTQPTRLP